jgi:long-chain acyl-CoA synthetase
MLDLARRCAAAGDGLERFAYVSTAYVAGRHRGVFGPADLDRAQRFRNPYERSKYEAEALVRDAGTELGVQVFRPSIVVGDRQTGWTSSFNVLYQPLRAFSRGMYSVLPGRLDAPVDVVPVDYVADAIWTLTRQPFRSAETHLLVSGDQAATVGELAELASGYFGKPAPRVVDPVFFRLAVAPRLRRRGGALTRAVLDHSAVYFPYFRVETWFDDSATRAALRPHGIGPTPLRGYFGRLADFAVCSRWGKRPLTRAQTLG